MATSDPPQFLLLLPPAPSSLTLFSLRNTFGDTLSQVLKEVATHTEDSSKAAILEIALACPHLINEGEAPRATLYDTTHDLLAGIYKLAVVIAAQEGVNVEDADGVDVRVLLLAWAPEDAVKVSTGSPYGMVLDLQTLASSQRQWQFAFGVESEAGEAMVKAFVAAKGSTQEITHLQSGAATDAKGADSKSIDLISEQQCSRRPVSARNHYDVAVGGTFDHLHIGHKLLLTMTIFAVDEVAAGTQGPTSRSATIGITGDQLLVNKKHASVLESWADRQKAVQDFVDSIINFSNQKPRVDNRNDPGPNGKSVDLCYQSGFIVKCTEIQDPFGPTITDEHISALIISAETRSGGKAVNDKRAAKGWSVLDVFEVAVLDADADGKVKEGFESKISSTAIRAKIAGNAAGERKS